MVKTVTDRKKDAVELGLLAAFTMNSQSNLGLLMGLTGLGGMGLILAKGWFGAAALWESFGPAR